MTGQRGSPSTVVLNVDGGSRGNPGPAGIGAVIYAPDGTALARISESIGRTTGNVAEYRALLAGLERAHQLGARHVQVRADSELVIRQMRGVYKVKSPSLRPLYAEVLRLAGRFDSVTYEHVPRDRNTVADALANQAMDQQQADDSGHT